MGNMIDAVPSTCEELIGSDEILSYTDKYVGNNKTKGGSKSQGMATLQRKVPADISEEMTKKIQEIAVKTFKILGCNGVSRIDFMIDLEDNNVYVNEINTIPGALSFYLWEATGKTFEKELDELVELAFKRNRERQNRTYSYDQNILALGNGVKGAKGAKQ
jgi:D-alanine-D-alanine ligase